MATFTCRTRDAAGSVVEKTLEASSQREAMMLLEKGGLFPIQVTEVKRRGAAIPEIPTASAPAAPRRGGGRVKRKELMQFSLQLGSSLGAGVPILASLKSIRKQSDSEAFRSVLAQMIADIEGGLPLSSAMRRHPRAFPLIYAGTIEAGEESGTMDLMLGNLAEYLEAEMEVRADVRSAVMYPAIVISTLCVAITVLIVFVVPRFAEFYSGFGAELPLPTRILITGSTLLKSHSLWVLIGLGGFAYGCMRLVRNSTVRQLLDRALLRIPLIGRLIDTASTLHVVQMLGLFTQAGVPVLEGLKTIANTVSNTKIKKDLLAVAASISAGGTLTDGMEANGCFPPAARQMLASGESTGSMERACFAVARHYKKELHYLTKNVTTFIEPLLTLVLAVVVLFVALAVFLPMWDLVKVVGK